MTRIAVQGVTFIFARTDFTEKARGLLPHPFHAARNIV